MTPENPLVGGSVLRIPAIQSPNYVAGTSGWAVFADGTAEFNQVTVFGTITSETGGQSASLTGGELQLSATSEQFNAGQVYEAGSGELLLGSGLQTDTDTAANIVLFSEQANGSQTQISLEASNVDCTGGITSTDSGKFDGTEILGDEVILATPWPAPSGYPFSGTPTATDLNNIVGILINIGLVAS